MMKKTNVMRILDSADIVYTAQAYDETETDGVKVARLLDQDPYQVFKTLVTVANHSEHYVFVLPVAQTLDLKKAAASVGVKSLAMIKQKELCPLTGYVHGGCSPIGMKKAFITVIDETCILYDNIFFSAGKLGMQVAVNPNDLIQLIHCGVASITRD